GMIIIIFMHYIYELEVYILMLWVLYRRSGVYAELCMGLSDALNKTGELRDVDFDSNDSDDDYIVYSSHPIVDFIWEPSTAFFHELEPYIYRIRSYFNLLQLDSHQLVSETDLDLTEIVKRLNQSTVRDYTKICSIPKNNFHSYTRKEDKESKVDWKKQTMNTKYFKVIEKVVNALHSLAQGISLFSGFWDLRGHMRFLFEFEFEMATISPCGPIKNHHGHK
ncbi:hypothetical protein KI387_032268, partial [Taxus chinensis]